MQEELFGYTEEEIDQARKSLANDVLKLRDLEDEKADTVKSYGNAIRVLKMSIVERAREIKKASQKQAQGDSDESIALA